MKKALILMLTVACASGCGEKPLPAGEYISSGEYGSAWPYRIPSGTLRCEKDFSFNPPLHLVTLSVGNDTYALNGSARDSKRFIDLDRILDNRPGGIKADGSAIISRGLALCNRKY